MINPPLIKRAVCFPNEWRLSGGRCFGLSARSSSLFNYWRRFNPQRLFVWLAASWTTALKTFCNEKPATETITCTEML